MYLYLYKQSDILALKRNRLSAQFLLLYIFLYFVHRHKATMSQTTIILSENIEQFQLFASAQDKQIAREKMLDEREHRDNVGGSIPKTTKGKKGNITLGNINVRKAQLVVIFGLDYR